MNTYLIPFYTDFVCDILKVNANSYSDCEQKLISKYINKYEDDDEIADIENFDDFIAYLGDTYGVYIGNIRELDEFE